MTTGNEYVAITNKRVMGVTDWRENFLMYLKNQIEEMNAKNFSTPAWLEYGATISADGSDRIKIVKNNSTSLASDGVGHFLDLNPTYVETTGIYFENQNTVNYYVHVKYESVPTDIQINPVSGQPEYVSYQDNVGLDGVPNTVTDNGGTITLGVNNVTESGVSNAGRKCLVYMLNPAKGALNKAIAIEECTVQWIGGANEITTVGTLGQTTVSTTAADYKVVLLGPRVNRHIGASITEHTFVGVVTGVGAGSPPTSFDHSGQLIAGQNWADILINGLGQDFFPNTDDTYDLGTSALRWKDFHLSGAVTGDLIPSVDDTYDLGAGSKKWKDLYLDGTAYIDVLNLSTTAGEGVASSLIPDTNDTHDLGATLYRWKDLYAEGTVHADSLALSSAAGEGVTGDLVPNTNNAHDLGAALYRWNDVFANLVTIDNLFVRSGSGQGIDATFAPSSDDAYDLGRVASEWRNLYLDGTAYIDVLNLSTTAGEGVASSLIPNTDDTHDLGHPSYQWDNLYLNGVAYVDTLSLSSAAGEGISSHARPTAGSFDLGGVSYKWRDLHLSGDANVFTLKSTWVGADLIPDSSPTYDLGSTIYYWQNVYAQNVYYKSTLTTFDTYDDLDLIEKYTPTSEIVTIEKGDKEYKVNKGDVSTIPWPMLGKIDPCEGDHFLDLGDSSMFLLGAIKQLFQLHKREVQTLNARIDQLTAPAKA